MPAIGDQHAKIKSLHWTGTRWELTRTKNKNPAKCQVSWCRNDAYVEYRVRRDKDGNVKSRGFSKHSICTKCLSRRWRANHPDKAAYKDLRHSARKRNIPFRLSFSRFLELCESSNYLILKGVKGNDLQIDRIDVNRGYEDDNVRVISAMENVAKGNTERQWRKDPSEWEEQTDEEWLEEECPF